MYNILLADFDERRAGKVAHLLERDYGSTPATCQGWDELNHRLKETHERATDLVVLADNLPGLDLAFPVHVDSLCLTRLARHVIGISRRTQPDAARDSRACVLPYHERDEFFADLDRAIQACGLTKLPSLPEILYDEADMSLHELITSLHPDGNLEVALEYLGGFVRDLWGCPLAKVSRLNQGFSGAKIFRVEVGSLDLSYVLKVIPTKNLPGAKHEIECWKEISNTLDNRFKSHIAAMWEKAVRPHQEIKQLVKAGPLYAVAFEFLGKAGQQFRSLEDVYLELGNGELNGQSRTDGNCPAGTLLHLVLDLLKEAWYTVPSAKAEEAALWDWKDASASPSLTFPPYMLTGQEKADIRKSLEQLGELGPRLFSNVWCGYAADVTRWLAGGSDCGTALVNKRTVLVSPVHGDLNSNNILFWADEAQPFVIDFATYQNPGHTLQDFARLEAEVKFVLMDRERSSRLPALDHTPQQLPLWCAAEDHLRSENWENPFPTPSLPGVEMEGVQRAVRLVQGIRKRAHDVYNQVPNLNASPAGFLIEYHAASLYHSLRCIQYKSLSWIKRLLAVYCTTRSIECLRHFSGA